MIQDTRTTPATQEEDWTFADANTQYMTHGLHPYPARMIPQIARKLIIRYTKPGPETVILDPFAGSGGVLVESSLKLSSELIPGELGARRSYGIDINPLAILLAKAKTTPLEPLSLRVTSDKLLGKVKESFASYERAALHISPPHFFNIDFWFKPKVKYKLQIIREAIGSLDTDDDVMTFLKTCFSKTVRETSNTRPREFKLFRIPGDELKNHNPDVYETFKRNVEKGLTCMEEYYSSCEKSEWARPTILDEDTRHETSIPRETVNLVATSPPYGDSRTTVAYGQFSRLSMQWLDIDGRRSNSVDKRSLGGVRTRTLQHDLNSPSFSNAIERISSQDKERAKDVLSYFIDLNSCLREIDRLIAQEGRICIVIGNRSVKGVTIPTDQIIIELGQQLGLRHDATYKRRIPMKRMPWENSPSNIPGSKAPTIHHESIVVLKKS